MSDYWTIVGNKLKIMQKEAVVTQFKVLSWFFLEGQENLRNNSIRIVSITAKTWTEHFPNTSQRPCCLEQLTQLYDVCSIYQALLSQNVKNTTILLQVKVTSMKFYIGHAGRNFSPSSNSIHMLRLSDTAYICLWIVKN
jgi:hypothetical protein